MKQLATWCILYYLRFFAWLQLAKIRPRIVGITGSAGKTSTMEAVAAVLEQKYTVKVGRKANSETGIPLNILDLQAETFTAGEWLRLLIMAPIQVLINWKQYDWYVVEMGIDGPTAPRNMGYLLTILKPAIGICTSVGSVHAEAFDPVVPHQEGADRARELTTAIAQEKGKLLTTLPETGLAVLNGDYPDIVNLLPHIQAHRSIFGSVDSLKTPAIQAGAAEWNTSGTRFHLHTPEHDLTITIPNMLLPAHFASSLAAALCIAKHLQLPLYQSARALEKNMYLPPARGSILPGINNSLIIDSSYNSSLKPTSDFLHMLHKIETKGRKIAVLGDMRELGSASQAEHEQLAHVAATTVDQVVLVGPQTRQYMLPVLKEAGLSTYSFTDSWEAGAYLQEHLHHHDLVLFKGSQNTILLEIAIEMCLADRSTARSVLCRQDSFWDEKRQQITDQHR